MIDSEKKTQIARVLLTKTGRGSKQRLLRVDRGFPVRASDRDPDVIDVEAEGEVTLSPAKHVAEPMAQRGCSGLSTGAPTVFGP